MEFYSKLLFFSYWNEFRWEALDKFLFHTDEIHPRRLLLLMPVMHLQTLELQPLLFVLCHFFSFNNNKQYECTLYSRPNVRGQVGYHDLFLVFFPFFFCSNLSVSFYLAQATRVFGPAVALEPRLDNKIIQVNNEWMFRIVYRRHLCLYR